MTRLPLALTLTALALPCACHQLQLGQAAEPSATAEAGVAGEPHADDGALVPGSAAANDAPAADDEILVVPMTHPGGHIQVDVTINGKGPYLFNVDTYASIEACIDDDLARELKLPITGTTQNSDGWKVSTRDIANIAALDLGAAHFTDVRTLVDDYDWIGESDGRKVQGLLGFPLFRQLLLTIDYPGSRLVLAPGTLERGAAHTLPYTDGSGSPDVTLEVCGEQLPFGLDTGHGGTLLLQHDDAEALPLQAELRQVGTARTAYSSFPVFGATLDGDVVLAGQRIPRPSVLFSEGAKRRLLGHDLLQTFEVTFDQRAKLVRFALPTDEG